MLAYMNYLARYHQPYIKWSPPNLAPEEEALIGEQVATVGKTHFRTKFRDGISFIWPGQELAKQFKTSSPMKRLLGVALALAIFGGCAAINLDIVLFSIGATAILLVWIYLNYYISVGFAVARYELWLQKCLNRFSTTKTEPR